MSDEDRVSTVSSPKTETETETETETGGCQDQDRDQDSEVPRPRPRPRLWGSKTETEIKTCKNGSRDVSRPRLKSRELQVCMVACTWWPWIKNLVTSLHLIYLAIQYTICKKLKMTNCCEYLPVFKQMTSIRTRNSSGDEIPERDIGSYPSCV